MACSKPTVLHCLLDWTWAQNWYGYEDWYLDCNWDLHLDWNLVVVEDWDWDWDRNCNWDLDVWPVSSDIIIVWFGRLHRDCLCGFCLCKSQSLDWQVGSSTSNIQHPTFNIVSNLGYAAQTSTAIYCFDNAGASMWSCQCWEVVLLPGISVSVSYSLALPPYLSLTYWAHFVGIFHLAQQIHLTASVNKTNVCIFLFLTPPASLPHSLFNGRQNNK